MTSARDPTDMSPEERLTEVAFLMATGYLRLLVSRQKELEGSAPAAAPCAPVVDGQETVARKETT